MPLGAGRKAHEARRARCSGASEVDARLHRRHATETPFSSLGNLPLAAWDKVPLAGKTQIIIFCGLVEFFAEIKKPHYTKGGPMGLQWDPLGIAENATPEFLAKRQARELANGRLAMIGIISFIAASKVPGSVPALPFPY